jgi:hypothetical protein
MPSNTTYNPTNIRDFEKTKLNFDAQGVKGTLTPNTTTTLDYLLTDDCLMTGLEVIVHNGNFGDTANLQAVDTTGITGYPAGTVLQQFATNWNIASDADIQIDMAYPAKIIAGLTLRVVYTSTSLLTPPFVAINYKLHKILV